MYTKCVWYISCVMSIIVCHIWESTEHFGKVVFHMICGESSNVPGSRRWMNPTCLDSWLCDGVFFAPWVIGGWNDHSQRALNCRRFNLVWWVFLVVVHGPCTMSLWKNWWFSVGSTYWVAELSTVPNWGDCILSVFRLFAFLVRESLLTFTFHWWLLGDPNPFLQKHGGAQVVCQSPILSGIDRVRVVEVFDLSCVADVVGIPHTSPTSDVIFWRLWHQESIPAIFDYKSGATGSCWSLR